MRNEEQIVASIQAAKAEYIKYAQSAPAPRVRELSAEVKKFQQELIDFLIAGAGRCPECDQLPIAIHQPGYYEVGCLSNSCVDRHSLGLSREEAVRNWNNQNYFQRNIERARVRRLSRQLAAEPPAKQSLGEKLRSLFR